MKVLKLDLLGASVCLEISYKKVMQYKASMHHGQQECAILSLMSKEANLGFVAIAIDQIGLSQKHCFAIDNA